MTSPVQLQPEPVIPFEERMKLILKPQPLKPVKSFLRNAHAPQKPEAQVQEKALSPQVQTGVVPPPVNVLPSSAQTPVQVSLKESYERVQQELYQTYKQEKRQVPRTPADQMVFVQSYKDAVELVKMVYAQGNGEKPPLLAAEWQKCYTETLTMFQTFYGFAQQLPEDLARIKRLYHQFYTQARKKQRQSTPPQKPAVPSPVSTRAQIAPPADPKQVPTAAQPVTHTVTQTAQPTSVQPMQAVAVQPAQPIARSEAASLDLSNNRRWTPQEHQRLQQGKLASQANPSPSSAQQHVSSAPATSHALPQNPPPIAPTSNPAQASMVPAPTSHASNVPVSSPQANPLRRDDSWSQQPRPQRDRQFWDPRAARREHLLRERLFLERELQRSFGNANALNERWELWRTHKAQLEQDKAFVPVKEVFSFVARRLVKIPLPSAARQISFREQRLNQEATWLQQQAIAINARHNALLQEIQVIDTELGMLNL